MNKDNKEILKRYQLIQEAFESDTSEPVGENPIFDIKVLPELAEDYLTQIISKGTFGLEASRLDALKSIAGGTWYEKSIDEFMTRIINEYHVYAHQKSSPHIGIRELYEKAFEFMKPEKLFNVIKTIVDEDEPFGEIEEVAEVAATQRGLNALGELVNMFIMDFINFIYHNMI